MIFNSAEECIAYIENAIQSCMRPLANEIKIIMDDVTRQQVRGWSNQIFSSVQSNSKGMEAYAEFTDNGHWYSLAGATKGEEVGNPIKFLEASGWYNMESWCF